MLPERNDPPGGFDHAVPPSVHRKHAPLLLWLALPLIVVAGLAAKVHWDLEAQRADQQYLAAKLKAEQGYQTLIQSTLNNLRYGSTPAQIAARIGIKRPLKLVPSSSGQPGYTADWTDPVSLSVVIFRFDANKRYTGRSTGFSSSQIHHLRPKPGKAQAAFYRLGRLTCPVLADIFTPLPYLLWMPLLVLYHLNPHRRAWLSLALVAAAVLFPLIWLMASFSLLEVKGVMSYDANFWGLIMFVVSMIALRIGGVSDRYDDPRACHGCGYSLVGNRSGTCPECGTAVPARQQALLDRA